MIANLKSYRWWLALALSAVAATVVACGSSSPNKGASASKSTGASSGGATLQSTNAQAPADAQQQGGLSDSDVASRQGAPAAAPPDGGAGGANPAGLASQLDRKIIQTSTLQIEASEVSKRFEDAGNIAASAGGFIASSSFGNNGDSQTASITIRVPADQYQRVLIELRKLGDVKSEQSGTTEVTEEYTDLQSRVKNLRAVEAQYAEFLGRAQNIQEVLTVQDRLNSTRAEIDQVQGRINLLDKQTELSTVTVHLGPPVVAKPEPKAATGSRSPLETARDSFGASIVVLTALAAAGLAVAAFSWWLVPVVAVVIYIGRRQMRPDRARQAAPPPAAST